MFSLLAMADVVSVAPEKLDFGSQVMGTYAFQQVSLTNPTKKALNISSISTGGDFSIVYQDCGSLLPAGYQCTIYVLFFPTIEGFQSATVTITDDANNTPQKVKLSGTGIPVQLVSISIAPANPSLPLGLNQQFTATGLFNNGNQQDLTSTVAWASSAPAIAYMYPTGLVSTAITQGVSTISATQSGVTGSTLLSVTAPVVRSIVVTPAGASIPKGLTRQFAATGTLTNRVSVDLTSTAQWSSSVPTAASVNASGLVTGLAQGAATISALSAGVTGSVGVTIDPALLTSVTLSPSNFSMGLNVPHQFTLMGTFSDGSTADVSATAAWSSDYPAAASVNTSGLVSPHQAGTADIRAEAVSAAGHGFVKIATMEVAFLGAIPTPGLPRTAQAASILSDGRVLITGGRISNAAVSSTEMYNPFNFQFTVGPSMNTARAGHTATLLSDGRVLIVGGQGLASAELYDPASGAFTATGQMGSPRISHTATLLNTGQVLITGGGSDTAELYDPSSGAFAPTGNMAISRSGHTATLLNDGRVLIAGGAPSALAEIFDPVQGTFAATGALATDRQNHAAVLMADGRVFLIGGLSGFNCLDTTEIFDPATGVSTTSAPMRFARASLTATLLTNGQVLVAGGHNCKFDPSAASQSAERFDPVSGTFAGSGDMEVGHSVGSRIGHTATALANGQVLLYGGNPNRSEAELYQPGVPHPPVLQ